ncbi:MAG TPA: DNA primase [Gaiellaceae bacterium]
MARLKDTTVEAVKERADFVQLVEARTQLRRGGANGRYMGRCPFHEEKTPSFSVNGIDKWYYCFGCGAKGDLITFVRETEGLDFTGAIEWLADRFGVPVEYEESTPAQDAARRRRDRLFALLEQAATYYSRTLWETEAGSVARDYLTGRGLGEGACRAFRLGLALGGNSLARKAAAAGFTPEELRAAGLLRRNGADYFARRLLFPLADARGRVVGFQARRLYDDDPLPAKYVNTPESELFHKGAVVYGLDSARAAIAKEDRACVVEGNTDVIALRQAGFAPVVACMGTALTERQLAELGRLTKRLWLAFDGDAAGESAALRGMELAVGQRFDVRVVALPPGGDPADDPSGFEARLAAAEPYLLYRVRVEIDRAETREAAFRTVRTLLDGAADSPERQDAWRYANDKLGMTLQLRAAGSAARAAAPVSRRVLDAGSKLERSALAGVLRHPALQPLLAELGEEHFYDPQHRAIRNHLVDGAPLDREGVGLLAELDAYADADGIGEATGTELLLRLRERRLQFEIRAAPVEQRGELTEALAKLRERAASISA